MRYAFKDGDKWKLTTPQEYNIIKNMSIPAWKQEQYGLFAVKTESMPQLRANETIGQEEIIEVDGRPVAVRQPRKLLPEEISDRRKSRDSRANQTRDERLRGGCTVNVTGVGQLVIRCDTQHLSYINSITVSAMIAKLAGTDIEFAFRDARDKTHHLNISQTLELAEQVNQFVSEMQQAAWAIHDMDDVSINVKDDNLWPPSYR